MRSGIFLDCRLDYFLGEIFFWVFVFVVLLVDIIIRFVSFIFVFDREGVFVSCRFIIE